MHGKGQLDEAIAAFREGVRLKPDASAFDWLGFILREKGKMDEAIGDGEAIKLDPRVARAHLGLGAILCNVKKDYDGAIAHFEKAIELDPKNADAHCNLGNARRGKGQLDKAIAAYGEAIKLDPKHTRARICLAGLLATRPERGPPPRLKE